MWAFVGDLIWSYKLSAKSSKVSDDWLGEWYSDIKLHILPPNDISKFMHSFIHTVDIVFYNYYVAM